MYGFKTVEFGALLNGLLNVDPAGLFAVPAGNPPNVAAGVGAGVGAGNVAGAVAAGREDGAMADPAAGAVTTLNGFAPVKVFVPALPVEPPVPVVPAYGLYTLELGAGILFRFPFAAAVAFAGLPAGFAAAVAERSA